MGYDADSGDPKGWGMIDDTHEASLRERIQRGVIWLDWKLHVFYQAKANGGFMLSGGEDNTLHRWRIAGRITVREDGLVEMRSEG